MQKDSTEEQKQPQQLPSSISLASKLQIPRYSDKFKDYIAKSELARQQTSKPREPSPEPTPPNP
jgi:hypothetical protein